jgi:PrgI family protein
MAVYQVPQFLDSGEKIFGSMNIRQLAYALLGFFVCIAIYSIFSPALGLYGIIPCFPFIFVFAYLAIGKYNGRDTEVYVLKMIIFFTKPRMMKYTRQPDYTDIDARMNEWTVDKVMARWSQQNAITDKDGDGIDDFTGADYRSKIERIRSLTKVVDHSTKTVLDTVVERERDREQMLEKIRIAEESQKALATKSAGGFISIPTISLGGRKAGDNTAISKKEETDEAQRIQNSLDRAANSVKYQGQNLFRLNGDQKKGNPVLDNLDKGDKKS